MLGTIIRISGIVIGIAAMLRLATNSGIVEYHALFQAWMDRLRDVVELGFIIDLIEFWIILPVISSLRSIGVDVPELQPHWQSVWVLLWLVFAATSRYAAARDNYCAKFGILAFGGICALISTIITGIVPISHPFDSALFAESVGTPATVMLLSFIGPFIFYTVLINFSDRQDALYENYGFSILFSMPFVFGVPIYIRINYPGFAQQIENSQAVALLLLIAILIFLIISAAHAFFCNSGRQRFKNAQMLVALDVFTVLILALVIAYFAAV